MTGGEPEVVVGEPGKREKKGTETAVDDERISKAEVISNNCEIVNAAATEILLVSLLFCSLIEGNAG